MVALSPLSVDADGFDKLINEVVVDDLGVFGLDQVFSLTILHDEDEGLVRLVLLEVVLIVEQDVQLVDHPSLRLEK